MTGDLRPVPRDPSHDVVAKAIFDADESWLLTGPGDYMTWAAETWTDDGRHWQRVVCLQWPVRRNKTEEYVKMQLMISPEDALGLAEVLAHTAVWLMEAAALDL